MPNRTGHPRLMSAVRKLGMRTGKSNQAKTLLLECQVRIGCRGRGRYWSHFFTQGSSVGIYTTQWLNEFHLSARGESAEDWLDRPKKTREKLPYPPIRLIYPTKTTVQESALGERVYFVSFFKKIMSFLMHEFPGRWNNVLSAKAVERQKFSSRPIL